MKYLLSLLLICSSIAFGQDKESIARPKPKAKGTIDTKSPVTRAEARLVYARMSSVLKPIVGKTLPPPAMPAGSEPVSRTAVINEFARYFESVKPAFKMTPRKVRFESQRLTLKDPSSRKALETLIAFGMVAKLGPLAAGDKETLTISQFGDSVGFFMSRVAELTHTPSAKWTPSLQP